MTNSDAIELHEALQGLQEQVKYVAWLCQQLGYIAPTPLTETTTLSEEE